MPIIEKGCIPEKRYSPRWWRHPKDENVSLRAKRSNLFDRDCFVACAPRNDIPSSLMRCHCCSFDRLPLFWNAPLYRQTFCQTLSLRAKRSNLLLTRRLLRRSALRNDITTNSSANLLQSLFFYFYFSRKGCSYRFFNRSFLFCHLSAVKLTKNSKCIILQWILMVTGTSEHHLRTGGKVIRPILKILLITLSGENARRYSCNFSKKGGTRPPSPREVNSRGASPAVGRFAPSGLPSLFPRLRRCK